MVPTLNVGQADAVMKAPGSCQSSTSRLDRRNGFERQGWSVDAVKEVHVENSWKQRLMGADVMRGLVRGLVRGLSLSTLS